MMITDCTMGWLICCLLISSSFLINYKNVVGYYVSILSNLLLGVYCFSLLELPIAVLGFAQAGFALWTYYQFYKSPKCNCGSLEKKSK